MCISSNIMIYESSPQAHPKQIQIEYLLNSYAYEYCPDLQYCKAICNTFPLKTFLYIIVYKFIIEQI
jgi:hypothetical protein